MSHSLPAAPSLEHLRNQAKALLKAARAHDPAALARLEAQSPGSASGGKISLAAAQFVIARDYGFPSWSRLKTYVESVSGTKANRRRPLSADVAYFNDRASGLLRSHGDAIPTTLAQIREFHPRFAGLSDEAIRQSPFTLEDARLAVAREHGFDAWQSFRRHLRDLAGGKTAEPFLTAFEAIRADDIGRLKQLLDQDTSLVNAWGTNGNTLLNLAVSSRKPAAIEALLAAGADVNRANKYGWTPLHQAAYSNQAEVARRLIEHGGALNLSARGDGGTPLVQALFWGHRELADELATHG
ncbi:MAG: ankyrin repeat domain-containing protein, partial [Chloroflexi bacterium]|nr:ankyrin repeat domain-containing protein [Chloroflexota bacterium]